MFTDFKMLTQKDTPKNECLDTESDDLNDLPPLEDMTFAIESRPKRQINIVPRKSLETKPQDAKASDNKGKKLTTNLDNVFFNELFDCRRRLQ